MSTNPVFREILLRREHDDSELPLETEGVLRYVWESSFGNILIEVIGSEVFVNGKLVKPIEKTHPPLARKVG